MLRLSKIAVALVALPGSAVAQSSVEQAIVIAGQPTIGQQRLTLESLPRAAGRSTSLFDGKSLDGWTSWLGYVDPAVTYRDHPGSRPIGTSRSTTGDFVGTGPVPGTIGDQQEVSGYLGQKLVNTFLNHDLTMGTITSPTFTISSDYIDLLGREAFAAPDPEGPPPLRSADPDDDYLIALAHGQNALLVSGDKHLLDIGGGAPILAPADLAKG